MAEVRTLRIPDELWAWLQADADRYGRTVAQSVRFYLNWAKNGADYAAAFSVPAVNDGKPLQAWEKESGQ